MATNFWSALVAGNFPDAYKAGQQSQEFDRKTRAYNALRAEYGDIAGDPELATQLQSYDQNEKAFSLEQRNRQLTGDRMQQSIDQSAQEFPVTLQGKRFDTARTSGLVQDEATARKRAAQLNAARLLAQVEARGGDVLGTFTAIAQRAPNLFDSAEDAQTIHDALASGATAADLVAALSEPTTTKADHVVSVQPDAQGKLHAVMSSGAVRPLDLQSGRFEQGTAEYRGSIKEQEALGKARGETLAQDLPLSNTAKVAAAARINSLDDQVNFVDDTLDKALERVGPLSAGLASVTDFIPGTPASGLKEELKAAESQVLLQTLTEMKEMSKNGSSGFGQLSNAEGDTLRAKWGSISRARNPAALRDAIEDFRSQLHRSQARVKQAYIEDLAARGQVPAPASDDGWTIEEVR